MAPLPFRVQGHRVYSNVVIKTLGSMFGGSMFSSRTQAYYPQLTLIDYYMQNAFLRRSHIPKHYIPKLPQKGKSMTRMATKSESRSSIGTTINRRAALGRGFEVRGVQVSGFRVQCVRMWALQALRLLRTFWVHFPSTPPPPPPRLPTKAILRKFE